MITHSGTFSGPYADSLRLANVTPFSLYGERGHHGAAAGIVVSGKHQLAFTEAAPDRPRRDGGADRGAGGDRPSDRRRREPGPGAAGGRHADAAHAEVPARENRWFGHD